MTTTRISNNNTTNVPSSRNSRGELFEALMFDYVTAQNKELFGEITEEDHINKKIVKSTRSTYWITKENKITKVMEEVEVKYALPNDEYVGDETGSRNFDVNEGRKQANSFRNSYGRDRNPYVTYHYVRPDLNELSSKENIATKSQAKNAPTNANNKAQVYAPIDQTNKDRTNNNNLLIGNNLLEMNPERREICLSAEIPQFSTTNYQSIFAPMSHLIQEYPIETNVNFLSSEIPEGFVNDEISNAASQEQDNIPTNSKQLTHALLENFLHPEEQVPDAYKFKFSYDSCARLFPELNINQVAIHKYIRPRSMKLFIITINNTEYHVKYLLGEKWPVFTSDGNLFNPNSEEDDEQARRFRIKHAQKYSYLLRTNENLTAAPSLSYVVKPKVHSVLVDNSLFHPAITTTTTATTTNTSTQNTFSPPLETSTFLQEISDSPLTPAAKRHHNNT